MGAQVDKNKYNFKKYCSSGRWASYWHQVKEVLGCAPESVLEVGVGDRVMASYLKNNTDIVYKSLDIAEDLKPDILGSVEKIPVSDGEFDVVCAFEVLEHLPYEKFELALGEMKRVARKKVIISLPHWGRHFALEFRLPFFKKIRCQFKLNPFPPKHVFGGQHYWEIGKRGYPLKRIKEGISNAGLKLVNDYVVFEMPYHHFFVLEK